MIALVGCKYKCVLLYQGGDKPRPYPTTKRYDSCATQVVQGRGGASPALAITLTCALAVGRRYCITRI